jgi:hypothetical protein
MLPEQSPAHGEEPLSRGAVLRIRQSGSPITAYFLHEHHRASLIQVLGQVFYAVSISAIPTCLKDVEGACSVEVRLIHESNNDLPTARRRNTCSSRHNATVSTSVQSARIPCRPEVPHY